MVEKEPKTLYPAPPRDMMTTVNIIPTLHDAVKSVKVVIPSFHSILGMYLSDPDEARHCQGRLVRHCTNQSKLASLFENLILRNNTFKQSAIKPFSKACKCGTENAIGATTKMNCKTNIHYTGSGGPAVLCHCYSPFRQWVASESSCILWMDHQHPCLEHYINGTNVAICLSNKD